MIDTRGLTGPVWLASRSPRRRAMLRAEGIVASVVPSEIDERRLPPGPVPPEAWVLALACLKARRVELVLAESDPGPRVGTIIAADTACIHGGVMLGQPATAAAARVMLRRLRGDAHVTVTGVCLVSRASGARVSFVDRAVVRMPALSDEAIDHYVASGEWRGKAGAYNLADRIRAGWAVECTGDPATVMGLPLHRLRPWLAAMREESA